MKNSTTTDSLLLEVDADIRAERFAQLWLRHRRHILGLVVLVLVATALSVIWQHHRKERGGALMQQLSVATGYYDMGAFAQAAKEFGDAAANAGGERAEIAHLWQARALAAAGQRTEAVAILVPLAQSGNGLWTDMACLRLAALDEKQAQPCLARTGDSPLAVSRAEWNAAGLWQQGKPQEAARVLEAVVKNEAASPAMRARAAGWLETIRATDAAAPAVAKDSK